MIRSMTAFGAARAESEAGTLSIEFRSVNSRFLDINMRLPDDLRMLEGMLREKLSHALKRGKIDVRVNYSRASAEGLNAVDDSYLNEIAQQLQRARQVIADLAPPSFADLLKACNAGNGHAFDMEVWTAMGSQAADEALHELQANREREGRRLADMMMECAADIQRIVGEVEQQLPSILEEHQQKLAEKLRDALEGASPGGLAQISGEELSARIAQETSLFAMRVDVAEELSRLRSHVGELHHLLGDAPPDTGAGNGGVNKSRSKSGSGSVGKRLDFLFQEMNREANTLGSKAAAISVTRAAIDLKLLIEQLREQAQNIE